MKNFKFIIGFIAFCFLYSCKCHDITCPAFSTSDLAYINFNINDTLKYINSYGNTLQFIVTEKNTSASYNESCSNDFGGCYCIMCGTNGNIKAISDSSRNNINYLKISRSTGKDIGGSYSLAFNVFNFSGELNPDAPGENYGFPKDSLISSIILGSSSYSNVHFQQTDTISNNINGIINVYYTKQFGIIGFYDRQTHSLYYRQ